MEISDSHVCDRLKKNDLPLSDTGVKILFVPIENVLLHMVSFVFAFWLSLPEPSSTPDFYIIWWNASLWIANWKLDRYQTLKLWKPKLVANSVF